MLGQPEGVRLKAHERRALLVEAAIRAMSRDGVAHTTTRSIVTEAQMALGAFHYCFASKEELVLEVMRSISAGSWTAVGAVLDDAEDPHVLVRQAVTAYWEHLQAHPHEHQLSYELTQWALRHDGAGSAARAQYAGYLSGMGDFLDDVAKATASSWRTPVPVLARFAMAAIEGVTLQWLVDRDCRAAGDTFDRLADFLCHDLCVERPSQPGSQDPG